MSPVLKELERKALELSPQEREELADNILRSLDGAPLTAVDEAWVAEAERRYNVFQVGKDTGNITVTRFFAGSNCAPPGTGMARLPDLRSSRPL